MKRYTLDEFAPVLPPEPTTAKSARRQTLASVEPGSRHLALYAELRSDKLKNRPLAAALASCQEINKTYSPPLEWAEVLPVLERGWEQPDRHFEALIAQEKRTNVAFRAEQIRTDRAAKRLVDDEERNAGTSTEDLKAFSLAELRQHTFPERRALLSREGSVMLRAGNLASVYAPRGVGKTWFATTLALVAATGVKAMGFHSDHPCRVLYIDGEMSSREIQHRFNQLCAMYDVPPEFAETHFHIVGADWQESGMPRLDTKEGQDKIEQHVAPADLVMLDNRSCLFDPEGEKDATAWQPAQDWLQSLRRRGKAAMSVHHSNRQGGSRGHSKAEDALDISIKLSRPEDYSADQGARFVVEFDKARGIHGRAVAPFIACLRPGGWGIDAAKEAKGDAMVRNIREHLRAAAFAGESPKSANAVLGKIGGNRREGLEAWGQLLQSNAIQKVDGVFVLVEALGEL